MWSLFVCFFFCSNVPSELKRITRQISVFFRPCRFFGHSRAGRVTTSPTVPSRSPGAGGGYALTHHLSSGGGGGAGPRGGGRSQQQAPPPPPPAAQHQGYQFPEKSIDQLRGMSMSQPQPGGEPDDTYATPADTLPPSVGTRLIQPMKKASTSDMTKYCRTLTFVV